MICRYVGHLRCQRSLRFVISCQRRIGSGITCASILLFDPAGAVQKRGELEEFLRVPTNRRARDTSVVSTSRKSLTGKCVAFMERHVESVAVA